MKRARLSLLRAASVVAGVALVAGLSAVAVSPRPAAAATTVSGSPGYWLAASDGGVYGFDAPLYGSMRGQHLNRPVVGMAATTDGLGYWLVAADGGIFPYGDAHFYGSTGGIRLNQPIVGMAEDPVTGGYWLVAADGGVFPFNAPFFGSTGNIPLNKPVVGMAPTPDGQGYWLVASDGGIFNFGDANFYGSTGNIRLNQPVVGMAANPKGAGANEGYWLVAADGGIFNFGNASYLGSTGGMRLNKPVTAMSSTATGGGYWLAASDGGIFTFGDAPYLGSTGAAPGPAPVVSIASTDNGYPFPPGSTGYDVSKYTCPPYQNSLPPKAPIAIVEIAGMINGAQNPCYSQEAAWAGTGISSYIFMNPLPNPPPPESQPTACGGNSNCEAWQFGYYWAQHWVSVSRSLGVDPNLWWLDVEYGGGWSTAASSQPQNGQVIAGAVAGLRASGVAAGVYATNLQWSQITGNTVGFPGISLWVPGASYISGQPHSAQEFCAGNAGSSYAPYAGGKIVVVQWGYSWPNEYSGPPSPYDQDYACP